VASRLAAEAAIIQFMRESRRKLSQRSQPVALLLQSGWFHGFCRTSGRRDVGSTLASFERDWETREAGKRRTRASVTARALWETASFLRKVAHRSRRPASLKHDRFAADFAPPLQLPFKNNKHRGPRDRPRECMSRPPLRCNSSD